jgi:hypothetical protein
MAYAFDYKWFTYLSLRSDKLTVWFGVCYSSLQRLNPVTTEPGSSLIWVEDPVLGFSIERTGMPNGACQFVGG